MNEVSLCTTQQTESKPKNTKKVKYVVKSDFPYKARAIFGLEENKKQEAKK